MQWPELVLPPINLYNAPKQQRKEEAMGKVTGISGKLEYAKGSLEECKAQLLTFLNDCHATDPYPFTLPFHTEECVYLYSEASRGRKQPKCRLGDTVIVVEDANGKEYRRFVFHEDS